jgi:rubrerythrin
MEMAEEEHEHRRALTEIYQKKFGDFIPLVRRSDVIGFVKHKPAWTISKLNIEAMRQRAEVIELENYRFYKQAAERSSDPQVKKLLHNLAEAERGHETLASRLEQKHVTADAKIEESEARRRLFLLQVIQPGLVGLMDGSVSTLAPLFAAAFATGSTWETFLVGSAASVGAGISMGFAEGLSDDGKLTGRGHPLIRGLAAGIMTTIGGLGHALPYLIPDFMTATTIAVVIVFFELWAISWIRYKYMDTPFLKAAFQVAVGGFLVFLTGILIGNA